MRGTRPRRRRRAGPRGIIPALAGNTFPMQVGHQTRRDHPRACGEHVLFASCCRSCSGSSPRLRGTLRAYLRLRIGVGIIPALAGNTDFSLVIGGLIGDHPRACGEHESGVYTKRSGMGSSPRLRGTPSARHAGARPPGIIPALAGNTKRFLFLLFHVGDHPRACGEHHAAPRVNRACRGSSPRLRGTRRGEHERQRGQGIIPALAGNTSPFRPTRFSRRDHPRACGEHLI